MIITSQITNARLADAGKRYATFDMLNRGICFLLASDALEDPIQGFAKSHLLCQSVECFLKGLLLLRDYDVFEPQLRQIGHDLSKLIETTENAYDHHVPPRCKAEAESLNQFYIKHMLRYGGSISIFVRSEEFPRSNLQRYLRRLVDLCYRQNEQDFQELFALLK